MNKKSNSENILVLGGNGKTGKRIANKLKKLGRSVRIGSRFEKPAFNWEFPANWSEVLDGVTSIYIAYHPDLAAPGASEAIETLVRVARKKQIKKLVLLSGRGEEEAQHCEKIVQNSGIPSTILRCSWFNQNFSESFLRDMVLDGQIYLPVNGVREPFLDADDIADVAVAALTDDRHAGKLYELTGPELLTFEEVAAVLSEETGRDIQFHSIPREAFLDGLRDQKLPEDLIQLLDYLFSIIMDGRNESLGNGVQQALGRKPRNFCSYVQKARSEGYWGES